LPALLGHLLSFWYPRGDFARFEMPHWLVFQTNSSPCSAGGGAGGQTAKDALGNDVKVADWLKVHGAADRALTQGLKVCVLCCVVAGDLVLTSLCILG
jgi:hypothetical protein